MPLQSGGDPYKKETSINLEKIQRNAARFVKNHNDRILVVYQRCWNNLAGRRSQTDGAIIE